MSNDLSKELETFINKLEKTQNFTISKKIGKNIIKDINNKYILRCRCRKFDRKNLNINLQCPNPISTISNKCYHCDKYQDFIGHVHIRPTEDIIKQYENYAKCNNMVFKKHIKIRKYKKYSTNTYLKVKIMDYANYSSVHVYKIPDTHTKYAGKLVDKYLNFIGYYNVWIDHTHTISSHYKNNTNYVLDPENNIILLEYNLKEKNIYHNLSNRIYRKYNFSSTPDTFELTYNIIDN
jgi:hypothetical protein